jgi:hypothetical protein
MKLLAEVHVAFAALGAVRIGALDLDIWVGRAVPRLSFVNVARAPVELEGFLGVGHHGSVQSLVNFARNLVALKLDKAVPLSFVFLERDSRQLSDLYKINIHSGSLLLQIAYERRSHSSRALYCRSKGS